MEKRSILLPIKPQYAEKIFRKEKKYEFRKKLCKQNIQKMYVYATAPVKKVIGEVEVTGKVMDEKKALWKQVADQSGVTYDEYCQYFSSVEAGAAYCLGNVLLYDEPKQLCDFGIHYFPQSFVYIDSGPAGE